jgi:glycosyltransferase involved in cell wall biosynthesis
MKTTPPDQVKMKEPFAMVAAPVNHAGSPADRSGAIVIIGATVLGLGGIRTHLVLLCRLLRRHGVGVVVFATGAQWDQDTIAGLEAMGVKFRLPPRFTRSSRTLSALHACLTWPVLVSRRAVSVYCVCPGYSQLLLQRVKPGGALSIYHEIVQPAGAQGPAGKCAAGLDASVANSRKVARMMERIRPAKPVRVVPFLTADAPTMAPPARRQPGMNEELRVVYLGRLVAHKRPDQLVRRWRALIAHPVLAGAHLDIFGFDPTGKMVRELRALVTENKLSDRVSICGEYEVKSLPGILARSDLVVLPSLDEGLPLVLVEAMQQGVPFVATAAGGTEELGEDNPDVIVTGTKWEDFEAGLLAMAGKIRSGAIDSRRLHQWVETRYGYESVSRQWLDCLLNPRSFFGLHD